jgi:hypothetical protein
MTACNTVTVIDERKVLNTTDLNDKDSIVLLGRRHSHQHETERDYISCVGANLSDESTAINVIPEHQFIDAMYPYFEASTAPMDISNLVELVQQPTILEKFSDYHIRYLIWIEGNTETIENTGAITCVGGPAGCFGFAMWNDEAIYEAKIWDISQLALSGKISTETQGTSYLPAIILPIPLLASVKADACDGMATQLKQFLK